MEDTRINIIDYKLTLFKPIFLDILYIGLIIVTEELRHKLFIHYHKVPSAGHMGELKNLFWMRNRFSG